MGFTERPDHFDQPNPPVIWQKEDQEQQEAEFVRKKSGTHFKVCKKCLERQFAKQWL